MKGPEVDDEQTGAQPGRLGVFDRTKEAYRTKEAWFQLVFITF